jgi:hypothetical protein
MRGGTRLSGSRERQGRRYLAQLLTQTRAGKGQVSDPLADRIQTAKRPATARGVVAAASFRTGVASRVRGAAAGLRRRWTVGSGPGIHLRVDSAAAARCLL